MKKILLEIICIDIFRRVGVGFLICLCQDQILYNDVKTFDVLYCFQLFEVDMRLEELREMVVQKCRFVLQINM